jgi:hypothetical protein
MHRTIVVLATVSLALAVYFANVAWWFETEILDTDAFIETTLEAMEVDTTRDAAAAIIVDTLAEEFPLLRLLDAALVGLFSDLLGRDVIEPLIIVTATEVHDRIVEGDQSALIIDLNPYRGLLLSPLESLSPELAARVPDDWFRTVEVLDEGVIPDLSSYVRHTRTAAMVATLLAALLSAVILVVSKRWFSAVAAIGIAFILAGGLSALLPTGARASASVFIEDGPSTVLLTGVFTTFTEPLTNRSLVILGMGAVLSVVGLLGWLVDRERRPMRA